MTYMRTFRPSRWSCLDLEYPEDFPDSSSLAANDTMAMRFGAAVAATYHDGATAARVRLRLSSPKYSTYNSINTRGFVPSTGDYNFCCLEQSQASLALCVFNCNEAC